ncbi:LutC/YkgG family protein [Streptomyces albipurpureus]|uniref:LUD domain-containing protein n=1 Tax=Streptomyces albipurpureus TaxID=2897419 RepID=A0ABT0UM15_9ACTN|nr:LUD domain-containing protein [Streptomyces sp. CWNU-1]MCM2389662.1 LUD domain-containing protein [Streptomyces sp. CWNU-1]
MTQAARERILARIRSAVEQTPDVPPPTRDYLTAHTRDDPTQNTERLHRNLTEYRAIVHRATPTRLPTLLAERLAAQGAQSIVVPDGVPDAWFSACAIQRYGDRGPLTPAALDAIDAVITGCALAIAETGTIVLDGGPDQGRRALTLVPDLHICVVRTPAQIVPSVPLALPLLAPDRPLTWISGPSATSDIELDRVEGVHGPRRLEVVLLETEG